MKALYVVKFFTIEFFDELLCKHSRVGFRYRGASDVNQAAQPGTGLLRVFAMLG